MTTLPPATWDLIDCLPVSSDDTTTKFSPQDSGTSLYRIDSIANCSRNNDTENAPFDEDVENSNLRFFANASSSAFCLCVNLQTHIFSNVDQVLQLLTTIHLDHEPDAVAFSPDSTFLTIADRSGTIHVVSLTKNAVVFSQKLPVTSPITSMTFSTDASLMVTATQGLLFRFSNLKAATKKSIVLQKLDLSAHHSMLMGVHACHPFSASAAALTAPASTVAFLAWGTNGVTLWSSLNTKCDALTSVAVESSAVVRAQSTDDSLFLLHNDGRISKWDLLTLTCTVRALQHDADDFCLLDTADGDDVEAASPKDRFRLVTLSQPIPTATPENNKRPTTNAATRLLSVRSQHHGDLLFSVPVAAHATLVAPQHPQAHFHLVSLDASSHSLAVQRFTEALPTTTFYHLLHRGRFDDAARFALQFHMDVDLVHRVKATHLADEALRHGHIDADSLTALKDALATSPLDFVVDFCLRATMPSLDATQSLLAHALSLVSAAIADFKPARRAAPDTTSTDVDSTASDSNDNSDNNLASLQDHKTTLCTSMYSLGTFHIASQGKNFDGRLWQQFRTGQPERIVCNLLSMGRVTSAAVVWRRHLSSSASSSLLSVARLLASVPSALPTNAIISWLEDELVPSVSRPDDMSALCDWCLARAHHLELSEPAQWPANALRILSLPSHCGEHIFDTLRTPRARVHGVQLLVVATNVDSPDLVQLRQLASELEDILHLRDQHQFSLTLSDYLQESPATIALQLLDRVAAPELLQDAIEQHVRPYTARHSLPLETLLQEYCRELMDSAVSSTLGRDSPWEMRVINVLACIRALDVRVDITLELMRRLRVPWSDSVDSLIDDMLSHREHRRHSELHEQHRLMQLKAMLARYGVVQFNMSDTSQARALLHRVLARTDLPSAMHDALSIVNAYSSHFAPHEAYSIYLQNLCEGVADLDEDLDQRITALFASIDDSTLAHIIATDFFHWTDLLLDEPRLLLPTDSLTHQQAARAAATVAKLLSRLGKHTLAADTHAMYEGIAALQSDLDIYISPRVYTDSSLRLQLLQEHVDLYVKNPTETDNNDTKKTKKKQQTTKTKVKKGDTNSSSSSSPSSSLFSSPSVFRLASLLGVSRDDLRVLIATTAAQHKNFTLALAICNELYERVPDERTSIPLKHVCYEFAQCCALTPDQLSESLWNQCPAALDQLAARSVSVCAPNELIDAVELFRGTQLVRDTQRQCENGMYTSESDPNNDTNHKTDFFCDRGLVLDSGTAVPLACRFLLSLFPRALAPTSHRRLPYDQDGLGGRALALVKTRGKGKKKGTTMDSPLAPISRAGRDMIQLTRDNQLDLLSLRFVVHTVTASTGYLAAEATYPQDEMAVIGEQSAPVFAAVVQVIVTRALRSKRIDHSLALGLLLAQQVKDGFGSFRAALSSITRDYARLRCLALLGVDSARLWGHQNFLADCLRLSKNATWWQQMNMLGIDFDDSRFRKCTDGAYHASLVPALVEHTHGDEASVTDYSLAYDLPLDGALLACIEYAIRERPPLRWQRSLHSAVAQVANREALLCCLRDVCLPMVSAYDFDALRPLLRVCHDLLAELAADPLSDPAETLAYTDECARSKRALLMLDLLERYPRRAPATPSELESWATPCANEHPQAVLYMRSDTVLPAHLAANLPFHALVSADPWPVLAPELQQDTVTKLLPLARLLSLNQDQFYVTAIENMTKQLPPASFAKVRPFLSHVKDAHLAVMTAKSVADVYDASDESKTEALQCAVEHARRWRSDTAELTLSRLADLCRRTAVVQKLAAANLNRAPYSELIAQPTELIRALYENESPRFIQTSQTSSCASLHDLVEDIAVRYESLDLEKLRRRLVGTWLAAPSDDDGDLYDDTPHDTDAVSNFSHDGVPSQQSSSSLVVLARAGPMLQRIVYLLRHSMGSGKVVEFILNYAFVPEKSAGGASTRITYQSRRRALQALFCAASTADIEQVFGQPIERLKEQMSRIAYVGALASVGCTQTVQSFAACNKLSLVRSLWRDHNEELAAVRLCADLCLDYECYTDPQLWQSVLAQLLHFGEYDHLRRVLIELAKVPTLRPLPCVSSTWIAVMKHDLASIRSLCSADMADVLGRGERRVRHLLSFLQAYPFALDLDMRPAFRRLAALGHHKLSLECAVLITNPQERHDAVQELAKGATPLCPHILDWLADMKGDTKNMAESLRDYVYDEIDHARRYRMLLSQPRHWTAFVASRVRARRIGSLLVASILAGRLHNAAELIVSFSKMTRKCDAKEDEKEEGEEEEGTDESVVKHFLLSDQGRQQVSDETERDTCLAKIDLS